MASYPELRQRALLDEHFRRLARLPRGGEEYYELYFRDICPLVTTLLRRRLDEFCFREGIDGYGILVMPLSAYAEPHVLVANAVRPRRLILLVDGSGGEACCREVLRRLEPDLATRTEQSLLSQRNEKDLARLVDGFIHEASGRILVDVTGHRKSTAVRLTLAARAEPNIDLACLESDPVCEPGCGHSRPGGERLVFWTARDRRGMAEESFVLQRDETLRIGGTAATGFSLALGDTEVRGAALEPGLIARIAAMADPRTPRDEMVVLGQRLFEAAVPPDFRPVLARAASGGLMTIEFSDHRAARFPWGLLHFGGFFLQQAVRVRRTFTPGNEPPPAVRRRALLVVAPEAGDLPGLEAECRAISRVVAAARSPLPVTLLRGAEAGRERVLLELKRHGLAHFAGHGTQAGIELADGCLGPREIGELAGLPAFVFANVCDGASPDLARAFLGGGCRTLAGARWALDDSEAAGVVATIYAPLLGDGDILSAFHRAGDGTRPLSYAVWGERWLELDPQ